MLVIKAVKQIIRIFPMVFVLITGCEEYRLKVVEEKVPWNKLKKIDMIPDLGGDVDSILSDF